MRNNRIIFAALLCSASCIAQSAAAQAVEQGGPGQPEADSEAASVAQDEAPAADAADENTVVVTAQRREQRLQDVPISLSVTSGEALQEMGLTNLDSITQRMSNVRVTSSASSDILTIRGTGSGLNAGFEQSVATFVDGVYRSRPRASRATFFDVERVEVLKGPQTTYFGNNAIAGALNITTRHPGREFGMNASVLYSPSDGEYVVEGGVNIPLSDTFSARFATQFSGMNGYVDNNNTTDTLYTDEAAPHLRDWIGRVALQWRPSSNFRSDLRTDLVRMRDRGNFVNELVNCPPEPAYGAAAGQCLRFITASGGAANVDDELNYESDTPRSQFDYDMFELAWTNRLEIGSHTLTSTTGYFDHDFYNLGQTMPFDLPGVGGTLATQPFAQTEQYNFFSQELRLDSPSGNRFEYSLGAYFARGNLDVARYVTFYFQNRAAPAVPFFNLTDPIAHVEYFDQRETIKSVFASLTFNVTESLRINLGARYSMVDKEAHRTFVVGTGSGDSIGPDNFVPGPAQGQALLLPVLGASTADFTDPTRSDRKFMPAANIQYNFTPDVTGYVSFARGFKAGGFALSNRPNVFEEELVDAYEIGLRGNILDHRLFFSISGYLNKFSDTQEASNLLLPGGGILNTINNAAKAEARGVELSINWRASSRFTFRADVAYLDATYTSYANAPCTVLQTVQTPVNCTQDLTGASKAYAPRWSGSIGFNYTLPLTERFQLRFDPTVYFSSHYFQQSTIDPLLDQDGYAKVDLRIGFGPADGPWEIAVIGRNLTDQATGSYRSAIGTNPGTIYVLPERPRSIAFQVSLRY
jgi:iron complex outermembrane receptor protein